MKGYRLTLVMPDSTSLEHRQALEAYGAELVLTPREDGMAPAVARARELAAREDGALLLEQFENPANPAAHREGTGRELAVAFDALGAALDAFVAGRRHRRYDHRRRATCCAASSGTLVVAVEPDGVRGPLRRPVRARRGSRGSARGSSRAVLDRAAYDRVEPVARRGGLGR